MPELLTYSDSDFTDLATLMQELSGSMVYGIGETGSWGIGELGILGLEIIQNNLAKFTIWNIRL